jgi:hypothetical protein
MTFVESYGFADINISANGKELKLADGKKATLTYPVAASQKANAPATIPLWYYDYDKGQWREEGAATLQGDKYVGEVSHFTPWNVDVPIDISYLNGRVVDEEGKPIQNALVRCVSQSSGGWEFRAYSGEDGRFSTIVEADVDVKVRASIYSIYSEVRSFHTALNEESNDIGDIIIDMSNLQSNWSLLFGSQNFERYGITTIQDCDIYYSLSMTREFNPQKQSYLEFYQILDGGTHGNKFVVPYKEKYLYYNPYENFSVHKINESLTIMHANDEIRKVINGELIEINHDSLVSGELVVKDMKLLSNDKLVIAARNVVFVEDFTENRTNVLFRKEDYSILSQYELSVIDIYGDNIDILFKDPENSDIIMFYSNDSGQSWDISFKQIPHMYSESTLLLALHHGQFYGVNRKEEIFSFTKPALYYTKDRWNTFTKTDMTQFHNIRSAYAIDENEIWLATNEGPLLHIKDGISKTHDNPADSYVVRFYECEDGTLKATTENGSVIVLDKKIDWL